MSNLTIEHSNFLNNIYTNNLTKVINSGRNPLDYNHGKIILDDERKVLDYISMYFPHHIAKGFYVFNKFDWTILKGKSIRLIDWACGPATASLALMEFLRIKRISLNIKKIVFIDAGAGAINAASLNTANYLRNVNSLSCRTQTHQLAIEEIEFIEEPFDGMSIHLLSNMLDLDDVDCTDFAKLIMQFSNNLQYVFCIGPSYSTYQHKQYRFTDYLSGKNQIKYDKKVEERLSIKCYRFVQRRIVYCETKLSSQIIGIARR